MTSGLNRAVSLHRDSACYDSEFLCYISSLSISPSLVSSVLSLLGSCLPLGVGCFSSS